MGRANPILTIVIEDKWTQQPEIVKLREMGHRIFTWQEATAGPNQMNGTRPDLILMETGHQWNEVDWDYLPAALVTARARRKKRAK